MRAAAARGRAGGLAMHAQVESPWLVQVLAGTVAEHADGRSDQAGEPLDEAHAGQLDGRAVRQGPANQARLAGNGPQHELST